MPLDVFIASDSDDAANAVASFAAAAGLRPLRVGGLRHARELEGFQLLVMGLQANPAYGDFNWATGLKILD
jgi:predicted dinucleotide-binding enzyme